jgi:L-histidine Nalpha-methyltransferase
MAAHAQVIDVADIAAEESRLALTREVRRGLMQRPRSLASWIFYDAEGSRLFERITTLPEYYPTRTETEIFEQYSDAIMGATQGDGPSPLRLVELGAGTASKTRILLEAASRISDDVCYVPVDVSEDALNVACHNIDRTCPEVRLDPLVRNYATHPLQLKPFSGTTLVLYIGTSIGNFSHREAKIILRDLGLQLRKGDALLLGTDMVKD